MQMNILNDIMKNNAPELAALLTGKGFNVEQASQFLPEAAGHIMKALPGDGVASLISGNGASLITGLMQKIDIAALASATGINTTLATTGLNALLPKLVELVGKEGGGLTSLLGGNDELLGGMKKLGSKLFS